jgi:NAD(P)-dependent dehydrogenase (short-subunit alcohol dehydrogenase family)
MLHRKDVNTMSQAPSPVALVTGATSGLGYAIARDLSVSGVHVIVHGPDSASAQDAFIRLMADGVDPARLDLAVADFTRLSDVADLARYVSRRYRQIDVLVNNAAIVGPGNRSVTTDGNELTFQVNYLAPCLLTRLLTRHLRAGGGRMIAVSSCLHRTVTTDWADPQHRRSYWPAAAYAQSKLALTMFTRALARQQPDITAVSVHPGIIDSRLLHLYGPRGVPAGAASPVVVRLCLPNTPLLNGGYYDGTTPVTPADLVTNDAAAMRLGRLTSSLFGLHRSLSIKAA